ncbi:MAG TPA: ribosomal protein S18-alanine N-acetyltransferase [Anaerolineales bacterium]|nr:ribosomal protein S18-alanine N-acetyltransferase [Anaerolineales bacterium]
MAALTRPAYSSLGVLYRPMRLEDIDAVHAIDQQSFSLPWPRRSYLFEVTENPSARPWVAELEPPAPPAIVGMVVTWLIMDEAHIATIAVHPEYRGRGIGRRLLAAVLFDCYVDGARSATLEVRVSNQVAQQMYTRFGFEEVGRRAHYYHDNNEDAVIMTRSGMDEQYKAWLDKERHT